jgi:hypothetical protein
MQARTRNVVNRHPRLRQGGAFRVALHCSIDNCRMYRIVLMFVEMPEWLS